MKKIMSVMFCVLFSLSCFSFAGCGSSNDAKIAVDTLKAIGEGKWDIVFENLHPVCLYTPSKGEFVLQMPYHAKALSEFFKGATFEVVEENAQDSWVYRGKPVDDANKVTLRATLASDIEPPSAFPFAMEFSQTNIVDFIVAKADGGQRKLVLEMGDPPMAHWAAGAVEKGEFSSPEAKIVVDPEPSSQTKAVTFFEVFDSNYKHKYWSAIMTNVYTKTIVIAINDDMTIRYVMPVTTGASDPSGLQYAQFIFEPYKGATPEQLAFLNARIPQNDKFTPYAMAVRSAVASAVKLFIIDTQGYPAYQKKYPYGILSFHPGTLFVLPKMKTDSGKEISGAYFKGRPYVVIFVSSCASCRKRAREIANILGKFGIGPDQVVFLSSSEKAKLEEFLGQIKGSHLFIDLKKDLASLMLFDSTPSLLAVDSSSKVVGQLDSTRLNGDAELNELLPKLTR
ncbi:MAG: hypothetical protein GX421_05215 [Caldisericales bacterium]|nr:hypothetical protein [Caldisericales bacterium]